MAPSCSLHHFYGPILEIMAGGVHLNLPNVYSVNQNRNAHMRRTSRWTKTHFRSTKNGMQKAKSGVLMLGIDRFEFRFETAKRRHSGLITRDQPVRQG
ncbi:hypothetical protein SAMN06265222_12815 [Neorhodopirellula lusitana]|uniref:Uncharacterized protein n=1 Tax=Neorhodopirellula lusitana TaxID=445327 RepID=A0ABY1QSD2_9BACT|nr:hypothetical protein SAMN06265222_12815 [Neorhodopirellula lusitana]